MIALQNSATSEQKARWLQPLLEAKTRSAFGMTEPDVASSDATNIATRMVRDGDDYVINGGNGHHRRGASALQLPDRDGRDQFRRGPHQPPLLHHRADGSPGVRLVRRLRWMGCKDRVAPMGDLTFDNVRVPRANLLGAEGEGFKVAQMRLGPARSVSTCARSDWRLLIELINVRSPERVAFGEP